MIARHAGSPRAHGGRARRGRAARWGLALVALLLLHGSSRPQSPAPVSDDAATLALSSDLRVAVRRGRDVELELRPALGDTWAGVALRIAGDRKAAGALAAWNPGLPLDGSAWVRIPLAVLSDDFRILVLGTLFPQDRRVGDEWIHHVRSSALPLYDEGLWQVAEWFTGDGASFPRLMAANGLSSPELRAGQQLRIPLELLHPALVSTLRSDDGLLEFGRDTSGPFGAYRLRPGEALYSSVIVRFTGRTAAADVREIAQQLQQRNAIRDLRDIPAGLRIKIPLDLIEPQFLPAGHPRREEAESARAELARELARQPAPRRKGLQGVLIVLDPGHGGRDLGTMNNGIWEHDYVYDVACRLKQRLERETQARVLMTLEDAETACVPSTTDKLQANRQGTIQTTPPFLARENGEAKIGVNLRWYLANSWYRKALAAGTDPDRVLFVSLHADSRHPSLRGLMVYVPGASHLTRTYGHNEATYRRFREVQEKPLVKFSKKERVRSEALSQKLAEAIVEGFRQRKLPVQPYQPVRNQIIRGKQRYVPAVLRGNEIPGKVLVEMVNLSNPEDAALLAAARDRERLAEGLHQSLMRYFGDD